MGPVEHAARTCTDGVDTAAVREHAAEHGSQVGVRHTDHHELTAGDGGAQRVLDVGDQDGHAARGDRVRAAPEHPDQAARHVPPVTDRRVPIGVAQRAPGSPSYPSAR